MYSIICTRVKDIILNSIKEYFQLKTISYPSYTHCSHKDYKVLLFIKKPRIDLPSLTALNAGQISDMIDF